MKTLEVENLQVYYGTIHTIKGISFHVNEGEIVSLIGANGAGKTTTLRALSGLKEIKSGRILLKGIPIEKLLAHERVHLGLAQTPEGRGVFPNLTVLENLEMGAFFRKDKKKIKKDLNFSFDLFPRLKERSNQYAGTLSGGEQQMLAIGRALLSKPKMLLLDEPSMGLAPLIVNQIFEILLKLNHEGVTILLVEQNARMALKISQRAYCLETGKIFMEGTGASLLQNDEIRSCYLGGT